MKRIKMSWKNRGIAFFWPDYPFVIAGNEILEKIIFSFIEKRDVSSIVEYLTKKYKASETEACGYVKNIHEIMEKVGVCNDGRFKPINNIGVSHDQNNLAMATLNITRECNLKCNHCYAEAGKSSDRNEMSETEIENAIIDLSNLLVREPRLLILSGGEPTLKKEKLKMAVEAANKAGLNIRLNTNGHAVDDDLAKFLSEKKVLVQVSLDGSNEKTNSLLRKSRSAFFEAISAINRLVAANCRTRISCTVHSGNVNEIPSMICLAEDLGVEQFTTSSLVAIGNALRKGLKAVEYKEEFEILYSAVKSNPDRQKMTKSTLLAETINAIRAGIRFTYCGTGSCTCCIDADGNIYPCINMARPEYRVGNIVNGKFSDLCGNSQILKSLRNLNVETINRECSVCDFRFFCGAFCRGETLAAGKNINSPYVRCKEWKRGIIKIMSILSESPDIYFFGEDPFKGVMHRE